MIYRVEVRASIGVLRFALAFLHLAMAAVGFHRPHLVELIPSYAGFAQIAPTSIWALSALVIGIGMLLIRRGSPLLVLWQFFSAGMFILFSILVTQRFGLTWGTVAYMFPAILSYIVMWFTVEEVAGRFAWLKKAAIRRAGRHG